MYVKIRMFNQIESEKQHLMLLSNNECNLTKLINFVQNEA